MVTENEDGTMLCWIANNTYFSNGGFALVAQRWLITVRIPSYVINITGTRLMDQ